MASSRHACKGNHRSHSHNVAQAVVGSVRAVIGELTPMNALEAHYLSGRSAHSNPGVEHGVNNQFAVWSGTATPQPLLIQAPLQHW